MEKTLAESPEESAKIVVPDEANEKRDPHPSSSNFIPEDTLISELPLEVWEHIFNFLSSRERKNASLVCTKWNEVANHYKYGENEKFVFRGYQNFEIFFSSLSNTKRNYLNLEFHNCSFFIPSDLLSLTEKIRFLSFRNCSLSDEFLIELFRKCDHLKEFYYKNTDKLYGPHNFCFSAEIIESLIEQQFVNKNLKSLRVYMHLLENFNMTDENIESIFHLFPNIKHLTFCQRYALKYDLPPYSGLGSTILSMKHELESLKISLSPWDLRLLMVQGFKRFLFILSLELNFSSYCCNAKIHFRLKKISLYLIDITGHEDLLFDVIGHLEYLEELTLKIDEYEFSCPFISRFIRLLDCQCLHLKHLKLDSRPCSNFSNLDAQTFRALVFSKLVTFKTNIIYSGLTSDFNETFTPTSFTNKTLRTLRVPYMGDHQILTLFFRCFKNLKFLQFQCYTPEAFKLIGCLPKDLTILKLTVSSRETWPHSGPGLQERPCMVDSDILKNCLSCLPSLESLHLSWEKNSPFSYKIIPRSVKYLRLFIHTDCSLFPLTKVIGLETIHIVSSCPSATDLRTWTEICNSLKKLRMLSLVSMEEDLLLTQRNFPFSETHQRLFECCPSLRLLVQKTRKSFQMFHFDYIEKRMKKVKESGDLNRNGIIYLEKISD